MANQVGSIRATAKTIAALSSAPTTQKTLCAQQIFSCSFSRTLPRGYFGMVAIGLRAFPLRKHKPHSSFSQDCVTADKGESSEDRVGERRKMARKGGKKHAGSHVDVSTENKKRNKEKTAPVPQASFIRKPVDAETVKYFSDIANVLEGNEMEMDERALVCGNALEEAKGKEFDLATDYIMSHTMQTLLEGCSVDHLCGFLQSCAEDFSQISMDRSGSHVAETALKSLARNLDDHENHSLIEETLWALCQAIVANPVDIIMCNCHGSHVLRRLLCLCKGVPVDSLEFHSTKSSVVLAERLNLKLSRFDSHEEQQNQSFPDQLKLLISELSNPSKIDIAVLQKNQYSSLVLQTALKLLAGEEDELSRIIPVLLGCHKDNVPHGNFMEAVPVKKVLRLVEDNAYSHLMEVILAVAPDTMYNEIFTKICKGSLFRLSSHSSANFVVQALISHARNQEHIKSIFEEMGSKFRNLLELGRSGVVAALIAACERLQILEHKCCQALADAVCLVNEPATCIVPRILFLDNYFYAADKTNWNWPIGAKIHVLGSLILQAVFKFQREFIQPYITSITSLDDKLVLKASKDRAGARVIEAFLISNASPEQKHKLIVKFRGHFGEISVLPSGSFIVDKCFDSSNFSMRETIVSELIPFQAELSKTKQGPYLLKKLDVSGFAERPEQWKSRQTSKQSAYKEFYDTFGPKDGNKSRGGTFLSDTLRQNSQSEKMKDMRKEINACISSAFSTNSGSPFLAHQGSAKRKKSGKNKNGDNFDRKGSKKHKVTKAEK
ncbi:Pumilio homolog 23 [Striga hermonthica]|uniref:Pumilio homolog 23 n=1 Tax=Striga hermonthica TaxID=68872 RepID=A0A9N7N376_STRHE|nr:Pumilio homolog 23 [Striga hermonthica]